MHVKHARQACAGSERAARRGGADHLHCDGSTTACAPPDRRSFNEEGHGSPLENVDAASRNLLPATRPPRLQEQRWPPRSASLRVRRPRLRPAVHPQPPCAVEQAHGRTARRLALGSRGRARRTARGSLPSPTSKRRPATFAALRPTAAGPTATCSACAPSFWMTRPCRTWPGLSPLFFRLRSASTRKPPSPAWGQALGGHVRLDLPFSRHRQGNDQWGRHVRRDPQGGRAGAEHVYRRQHGLDRPKPPSPASREACAASHRWAMALRAVGRNLSSIPLTLRAGQAAEALSAARRAKPAHPDQPSSPSPCPSPAYGRGDASRDHTPGSPLPRGGEGKGERRRFVRGGYSTTSGAFSSSPSPGSPSGLGRAATGAST